MLFDKHGSQGNVDTNNREANNHTEQNLVVLHNQLQCQEKSKNNSQSQQRPGAALVGYTRFFFFNRKAISAS